MTQPRPERRVPLDIPTLPDLLRPGLDLVFIGMNPGERSAERGHYYAHPGNAFWRMLSASPLVSRTVTFEDDTRLPDEFGIGLTDALKLVLTDSSAISDAQFREGLPELRRRIRASSPRAVCFTSTRPFATAYPRAWHARSWGRQPVPPFEGAEVWVMPSPSGRASAYHGRIAQVLADLAASLGRSERAA